MTRSRITVLLLLISLALPVYAKKKKNTGISQLFCQAQYVYVQAFNGDIDNPWLYPPDREEAEELEQQIIDWHRYTVVLYPHDADLVFLVRAGRLASAGNGPYPGGGPGIGPPVPGQIPAGGQARIPINGGPASQGPYPTQNPNQTTPNGGGVSRDPNAPYGATPAVPGQVGAEAGPPHDWMAIYSKPWDEQIPGTPLWEKSKKDGLQGRMPLFLEIKNRVDTECPAQNPAPRPKGK
jgi:hypothetical protein